MTPAGSRNALHTLQRLQCAKSAHFFIFHSGLLTKDEHDRETPLKPVPDLPYLRVYLDCLLVGGHVVNPAEATYARNAGIDLTFLEALDVTGTLLIEKSRQVFISWMTMCYLLWRAKYHAHQLIMAQSKREDDAAALVFNKSKINARLSLLESSLPTHLQTAKFPRAGAFNHVYFPNGSHVWGIPEGGEIIRSHTPSILFSDEAGFQPEFGAAYTASSASTGDGGQLIAASSSNPGEFQTLVQGKDDVHGNATEIPGLYWRLTESTDASGKRVGALPCLKIFHEADPRKRPGTEAGDAWLDRALLKYPGGIDSPRWQKEMRIKYSAMGGTRLIPEWPRWRNNGAIVIKHGAVNPMIRGYKIYGSYDHGWRNPACYLAHVIDPWGIITTFWEFYADRVPTKQIAQILGGETVKLSDGRIFAGNPVAGLEVSKYADPNIWATKEVANESAIKNVVQGFNAEGVFFERGIRGGDVTVGGWLVGHHWANPLMPTYRVTENCVNLIRELGAQRYKDLSAQVAVNANSPEKLVDRDNHAFDALCMFLMAHPPQRVRPAPSVVTPGTFKHAQQMIKKAKKSEPYRRYQREVMS